MHHPLLQVTLRLADVRKLIPGLPADAVLAKLHADGVMPAAPRTESRIKAEALQDDLKKATDPGTLAVKRWLQREVLWPAEKGRERA